MLECYIIVKYVINLLKYVEIIYDCLNDIILCVFFDLE